MRRVRADNKPWVTDVSELSRFDISQVAHLHDLDGNCIKNRYGPLCKPTVRDTATVTVSKPVKNRVPRQRKAKQPDRNGPVINVNPQVFAVAKRALRTNERLVIINSTTIITEYK